MANMELIEAKTVGSGGAASITFTSIPQTYTDLKIVMSARSTRNAIDDEVRININGTGVGTNFTSRVLGGEGASGTQFSTSYSTGRITLGIPGATVTASTFASTEHYFPNYTGSNNKSISSDNVTENNGTNAYADLSASLYSSSSAITSLVFTTNLGLFAEGSTASLYGISNVTSTAKATGGIVSSDATYWYHMFPYSGTFTPTQALTADYLVIAGGAGGGSFIGGGGGAGGLRSTVGATGGGGSLESALSLTANTNYTVTIGAGGTRGISASTAPLAGSNSVFSTITATGGGRGGYWDTANWLAGGNGGSGGGGGIGSAVGGTGTTNQGYAGGTGGPNSGGTSGAGGGGGAGAVGAAGANSAPGNGGNGVAISAFANATQTGVNTYYAGGGGGGGHNFTTPRGAGGLGGGGQGANTDNAVVGASGIANTGGGGGGAGVGAGQDGGNGGSGLVIIRYAI